MPQDPPASHDVDWYRARWDELRSILSLDDADEVVPVVRELQLDALQDQSELLAKTKLSNADEARSVLQRVHRELKSLREETDALHEIRNRLEASSADDAVAKVESLHETVAAWEAAGFSDPQDVADIVESMESQLDELYADREATQKAEDRAASMREGDTFEQLQALLAREEKIQRELGVSSTEQVIEMVNGLAQQLEDLYGEKSTTDDTSERLDHLLDREQRLQNELGVSDPEEVITMVRGLGRQLDELYQARERLARVNLDDAESVVEMVTSMEQQLEMLYASQERMSERGINDVDQALAMIESMEEQLESLYNSQQQLGGDGEAMSTEMAEKVAQLQEQLRDLMEEKDKLLARRQKLEEEKQSIRTRLERIEENVGTADPEAIASLIRSMEAQLAEIYQEREDAPPEPTSAAPDDALLDNETLAQLSGMSRDALNNLSVGAFKVDDTGRVLAVNDTAVEWPSVQTDDALELVGKNFFFELAPAANNSLFRGRFVSGVHADAMNERFPYTYIGKRTAPRNVAVHLYRSPDHDANWILFRRM